MIYEFSDLKLDVDRHLLSRGGKPIKLTKLSFKVLRALVEAAPAMVSHDDLIDRAWGPKRVVTPENLAQRIKTLRQSLGDDPANPTYIEGVWGEGYRLVPNVSVVSSQASVAPSERSWRWGLVAVFMALLAALFGWFVTDRMNQTVTVPEMGAKEAGVEAANSIAVLPFVNMSSDDEQEYFSDGLSEEMLNLLSRIPGLNVAARTSSFAFKDKDLGIPEIAAQLNVAHVLEGSVRKHGDQLRITAQLVRADNGYHLWSETYDRQLDNVFQIQEDIAIAVVDALRINLLGEAPKVRKTDPEAYNLFLEGQYLKRQISEKTLIRAVEAFEKAVEIDPAYAPAWAELADTYVWLGISDRYTHEERIALSDQAIEAAIGSDPGYAFAYYVRGISQIFLQNDFKHGIEDFAQALELDPDDAFLVAAIGKGAFLTGNYDLAITQYQKALAMEPVVPEFYYFLGRAYLSSDRLDEAEVCFRKLSRLSPSLLGSEQLWETLYLEGDLESALAVSDTEFTRAITHFVLGNPERANKSLANLIENGDAYTIARAFGYRGEVDQSFAWLNEYLESNDHLPAFIMTETAFRSLHTDERWPRLLEQVGLLSYWLEMTADRKKPVGAHS